MTAIAIRCRAEDHEAAVRFEQWLGQKRAACPIPMTDGAIRVSRLAPAIVTVRNGAGWLIEFESQENESPVDWQCVAALVTDLRLLGLDPTVLTPQGTFVRPGTASRPGCHPGSVIT